MSIFKNILRKEIFKLVEIQLSYFQFNVSLLLFSNYFFLDFSAQSEQIPISNPQDFAAYLSGIVLCKLPYMVPAFHQPVARACVQVCRPSDTIIEQNYQYRA